LIIKACEFCGKEFRAKRSDAKCCSERHRAKLNARKRQLAAAGADLTDSFDSVAAFPGPSPDQPGELLSYVEGLLTEHGRYDVPQARMALVVAQRLDIADIETGSGIVSLSGELDRLLSAALAGVVIETDELDELESRRRAKAAQAGN